MVSIRDRSANRLTLKKVLYHPLTWLAVGFHALLLFVPFDPSTPVATDPEDIQEEAIDDAIPIDILNLSDISTNTPPPAAATPPAPPPIAAAPPVAAPAPPVALPSEIPIEEDPLPAEPAEALPEALPVEEALVAETLVEEQLAYDPGEDQTLFISNLGQMALGDFTEAQGLPPAKFFREPTNAGYFLAGEAPVAGARDARWMDKGTDQVLAELQSTYAASGITFTRLEDYGGEELYELTTPTGESFMFISLARLTGSSLLVIWQANPLL